MNIQNKNLKKIYISIYRAMRSNLNLKYIINLLIKNQIQ